METVSFQMLVVVTAILGLGIGAAFAGGAYWGRRDRPAAAPTQAAAAPGGAGGAGAVGAAGFGGGAAGGAAAQATTGVVEEISGDTVTIRTQAGGTVSVKVQQDTQVRQLANAAASDIKPGQSVIVQGQPDVDGKVAARSVQITGTGGQGGPGGGAAGQGGPRPSGLPGQQGQQGQPQRSPGARPAGTATSGQ